MSVLALPKGTVRIRAAQQRRIGWAAIALGAYVGLTVARLTDLFPGLHLAQIGAILVLLLAVTLPPLNHPLLRHPGSRGILALFALAVLSVPTSTWPSASFEFILDYAKTILTFFLILYCARSARDAGAITVGLLGGVAVLAAATLIWKPERTAGITSTYDSNDVAFVMNCALPLVLIPAMTSGPTLRRVLAGLTSLLYVATIVASRSRAGFVTLIVVAILIGIRLRRRHPALVLTVGVALSVAVVLVAGADYWKRMATLWSPGATVDVPHEESYDQGGIWAARWTVWETGLDLVLQNPLLGVGGGAFEVGYGLAHGGTGKWSAPHNSFLQVAAELGLPGLVIFVALLLGGIKVCRRVARTTTQSQLAPLRNLAQALEISLFAYIVAGSTLTHAYAHLLYVVLGLVAVLPRLTEARSTQSSPEAAPMPTRAAASWIRRG